MLQCLAIDAVPILSEVPGWLSTTWSYFLVLLGFSIVVFVHELGHFAAAKWAGVRVEKFAVGFGKELFGFTKGETRYSFNVLPLGGYVKMLGQEDFVVDKSGELKVKEDAHSFTNKSVGKRMVVVTAGVVMNLIFAAIAFTIIVMVGMQHVPPVIGLVAENTPAGRAGLLPGDRILEVNGTAVDSFGHLSSLISLSDEGQELVLKVQRDGKIVEHPPKLVPTYVKHAEVRQIGVGPGWNRRVALPRLREVPEPRPDELHQYDELHRLMIDGRAQSFGDVGGFLRALFAARGEPVTMIVKRPVDPEALTNEQLFAYDPDVESTEVSVQIQPIWNPLPYAKSDAVTGSLLGLVPRLTVVFAEKSFAKAGARTGDVVARIGPYDYPTYAELKRVIEENVDQPIDFVVQRGRMPNHGLAADTVWFCVWNREALIRAAREDFEAAPTKLSQLAGGAGLPQAELKKLSDVLRRQPAGPDWRRWLERVDLHVLEPLVPHKPFALFSDPSVDIDARLRCADEDHLIVAGVIERFGDRPTPAFEAGMPRGAVILAVDGQPVRKWYQLTNAFREKAGRTVRIEYRLVDDVRVAEMRIPGCVQVALNLNPGDRIVKINDRSSFVVRDVDGTVQKVALPDWRATHAALTASVGDRVEVKFVSLDGKKGRGRFAATAENADPWLDRMNYAPPFVCYSLLERHPVHNPFVALVTGVRQAHRVTMQTIRSIKHMIFTRKVGLSKISGPLGIAQAGSKIAETGVLELLWFLGLISANLAVINFLPLPIVDGGLFLFLLLEKIRGEPVSIKTQVATQILGIALIATLFILVTYQDFLKFFS